eukprot:5268172-Amphidinium_carterae.1
MPEERSEGWEFPGGNSGLCADLGPWGAVSAETGPNGGSPRRDYFRHAAFHGWKRQAPGGTDTSEVWLWRFWRDDPAFLPATGMLAVRLQSGATCHHDSLLEVARTGSRCDGLQRRRCSGQQA